MIDGETAKQISIDVANDVSPRDSKHLYSEEMLAMYARLQAQFAAIQARNPKAVIHVAE